MVPKVTHGTERVKHLCDVGVRISHTVLSLVISAKLGMGMDGATILCMGIIIIMDHYGH